MKAKKANTTKQNKDIMSVAKVTAFTLAIPFVAMQFTDEVDWNLFDFVLMGALLMGTGLIYVLVVKKIKDSTKRTIIAIALFAALLLIWAELAVGIFGTPFAGS